MKKVNFKTIDGTSLSLKDTNTKCRKIEYIDSVNAADNDTVRCSDDPAGKVISLIVKAIALHDYYKGAYFWKGDNGNSLERTSREKWRNGHIAFVWDGDVYTYTAKISQSRANTYVVYNKFLKNDSGNLRDWKKLLNKLQGSSKKLK